MAIVLPPHADQEKSTFGVSRTFSSSTSNIWASWKLNMPAMMLSGNDSRHVELHHRIVVGLTANATLFSVEVSSSCTCIM